MEAAGWFKESAFRKYTKKKKVHLGSSMTAIKAIVNFGDQLVSTHVCSSKQLMVLCLPVHAHIVISKSHVIR